LVTLLVYTLNTLFTFRLPSPPASNSNKSKKGILLGFESSNNFIVYIPKDNKVIISRDIVIKEELNYKDNYKLDEDYNTLLELDSLDYNNYILIL
jgi:hypothetical protein